MKNKEILHPILVFSILLLSSIASFGQNFALNPFVGYNFNHSNRADYRLPLLNNNYNLSPVYGLDIKHIRETISYSIGFNTFNLVNEFNLRGDPIFFLSNFNYLTRFRTYNFNFSIDKKLLNKGDYTLWIESGVDFSYSIRNNYPLYSVNVDSIFFKANEAKITFKEWLIYLKENTFGVFISLNNELKLNSFLSLNLKITGRFGITPKFQSNILYWAEDAIDNFYPKPSDAYILNKGDYIGCNLGLVYYFNIFNPNKKPLNGRAKNKTKRIK